MRAEKQELTRWRKFEYKVENVVGMNKILK